MLRQLPVIRSAAALLVIGAFGVTKLGCTFVLDHSAEQCSTDADCSRFEGNLCDQAKKVCVLATSYCFTNAQCIDAASGLPSLCDKRDHSCKVLTDKTVCKKMILAHPDDLRDDNTVVFALPWVSAALSVFETGEKGLALALDQLGGPGGAGGLPPTTASNGKARQLAWLSCDLDPNAPDQFPTQTQMDWLTKSPPDGLNGITPLMIGHFLAGEANIQVNSALPKDMLILGQVQVFPSYESQPNFQDRFFSFYPRSSDYYTLFAQLAPLHEQAIRKKGITRDLRVTVAAQTNGLEAGNLAALEKGLIFNGKTPAENGANYQILGIGDGTVAAKDDPAFQKALTNLEAGPTPDILICGVSDGCSDLFIAHEKAKPGQTYYLLSEQLTTVDFTLAGITTEADRQRVLGVLNAPLTPSPEESLFNTGYSLAYQGETPEGFGWFLYKFGYISAFLAAGLNDKPVTGANLGEVLRTQFKRNGLRILPQQEDYPKAFAELRAGRPINFEDIEFDEHQQEVLPKLYVYCLDPDTTKLQRVMQSGLEWDNLAGKFTGTFGCWTP